MVAASPNSAQSPPSCCSLLSLSLDVIEKSAQWRIILHTFMHEAAPNDWARACSGRRTAIGAKKRRRIPMRERNRLILLACVLICFSIGEQSNKNATDWKDSPLQMAVKWPSKGAHTQLPES